MSLKKYEKNIQSQFGEDGVIEEIFQRIGCENRKCVEFGAWDGIHLSNTWHLWHDLGWEALLIEGDEQKFQVLKKGTADFKSVQPYLAFVSPEGETSLETILRKVNYPRNLDLLSIDIDGDDYYIFESLSEFRPRLVLVEYNPTVPPGLDIRQARGEYFGASALSLLKLAHAKGYRLAHMTDTNLFFVEQASFEQLKMKEPPLEELFVPRHLLHVISGYDGRAFLTGSPAYAVLDQAATAGHPQLVTGETGIERVTLRRAGPGKGQGNPGWLKRIVKKTFLYPLAVRLRTAAAEKQLIADWERDGRPMPPPQPVKRQVIKQYGRQFGTRILIETGTFMGDTMEACRTDFKRLFSIELDRALFEQATRRFQHQPEITIIQGDSGAMIEKVLTGIGEPCLFWLDGHYSEGITAKGELNTPILDELRHIFRHPVAGHVILIDDARCFTGEQDYPSLKALEKFVQKEAPGLTFAVDQDIIRIHQ
jgi:hypothetical protein